MTAIWAPETRFRIWFEIEAHALDAMAELGVVPREAAAAVWAWWRTEPAIDVARIDEIEAVTKHDVIAFLTWVSENVGPEARFLHQGMTSSTCSTPAWPSSSPAPPTSCSMTSISCSPC
jgi:adenylosuccinate lyase